MGMVAQVRSTCFEAHWCGIRIGGTDPKICCSFIGATDLALLPTFLLDPVMASSVLCRQFFVPLLRQDDRQWRGFRTERVFWQRHERRYVTPVCLGLFRWFR